MMGARLEDLEGMEGSLKAVPGLGLLPQVTTIEQEKVTKQSHFAFLQEMKGKQPVLSCKGYEIHMGKLRLSAMRRHGLLHYWKTAAWMVIT